MILVDTSVWVDHLRTGDSMLERLLERTMVRVHPFVVGELALGQLQHRKRVLALLNALPRIEVATPEEVLHFIERYELFGRGIGYVDVHLLAAVRLHGAARLWTWDKRLREVAETLNLAA